MTLLSRQKAKLRKDSTASTLPSSASACSLNDEHAMEDPWNEDNFRQVADLWNLTQQEQSHLRELQSLLADMDHWKNDPFEVVRYYREYRSVPKAASMVRQMVEWRLNNNIDTFLERYGNPPKLFHYLPTFLCQGLDRDGDPIYVERTGASDPYGLVCAYGMEALAEYTCFIREMTTTRRRRPNNFCWQRDYYEPLMGRRVTKMTVIMDMEGLSPRHMRGGLLGLLKRMARISQDMYAGMAKRVLIIRAPGIFQWGWEHVVKHFFDAHIRNIIVFSNADDYLEVMDRYIDLKVLPECLAPGVGVGHAMPGYFSKIHLEGGMIPKEEDYVPAEIEELPMCPSLDDENITVDGIQYNNSPTSSPSRSSKVGVRTGSLMVGVTAGSLLKGVWEESVNAFHNNKSTTPRTQVTVLSGRSPCGYTANT